MLREGAINILILSYNTIATRYGQEALSGIMTISLARVFVVAILALDQLVRELSDLGMQDETEKYRAQLDSLRKLAQHEAVITFAGHPYAARAA